MTFLVETPPLLQILQLRAPSSYLRWRLFIDKEDRQADPSLSQHKSSTRMLDDEDFSSSFHRVIPHFIELLKNNLCHTLS